MRRVEVGSEQLVVAGLSLTARASGWRYEPPTDRADSPSGDLFGPQAPSESVMLLVGADVRLAERWQAAASYSWEDLELEPSLSVCTVLCSAAPQRFPVERSHRFQVNGRYDFAESLFGRGAVELSSGARADGVEGDSRQRLDLSIGWSREPVDDARRWTVVLSLVDALDDDGDDVAWLRAGSEAVPRLFERAGRTVQLDVSVDF